MGHRALVTSPLFVASVVVLLLNDHVLKAAHPGVVTGKLSDAAGVVMVAIALTALGRRPAPAFALTAIAFAVLKTVPAAARAAAPLLGGVTRTDPTDLLALLALVPLWVWLHRGGPGRRTGVEAWRRPLRVAAIGLAVLATSATSGTDEGVGRVAAVEGRLVAVASDGTWESADGVAWAPSNLDVADADPARSCPAPDVCVLIEDRDGVTRVVEVTPAATHELLSISGSDVPALHDVRRDEVESVPMARSVAAVERPDGRHVVVSMGALGVLHRDPAAGEWAWRSVGTWGVPDPDGAPTPLGFEVPAPVGRPIAWGLWIARAVPTAMLIWFVVGAALVMRRAARVGSPLAPLVAGSICAGGAFTLMLLALIRGALDDFEFLGYPLLVAIGVPLLGAPLVLMSSAVPKQARVPPPWPPPGSSGRFG